MDNSPKISVIVPVYGVEKYIRKCIESILGQTFADIELILVDDGSIDKCPQICDEYAKTDSRIKVLHKENGGQGTARNAALEIAKGDYIGFVDGDDWIEQDMYQLLYQAIKDYDADIAMCDGKNFDGTFWINQSVFKEITVFNNTELMHEYISDRIYAAPWNKLYKREIFNELRFPSFRAREDIYIIHIILGKCKKAVHIGQCKYIQFIRKDSTENRRFNSSKFALIDAMKSLQEYINHNYSQFSDEMTLKVINKKNEILEDIVKSFMYNKYKNEYWNIRKSILNDYESLVSSKFKEKESINEKVKLISNNNAMFIFNVYVEMIKYKYSRVKGRIRLWLISKHLWWKEIPE